MPIEIEDDGFEVVRVKGPNDSSVEVKVDVYVVGYACSKVGKEWQAEGAPPGAYTPRLIEVFAAHGLPGLSGKAATELSIQLMEKMGLGKEAPPPSTD